MKQCCVCKKLRTTNDFYIRKNSNRFYSECKDCLKTRTKLYYKNNPWLKHLQHIKKRCNHNNCKDYKYYGKRSIKCLLTKEEIKKLWYRDKAYKLKQASIDRIKSDKNYTFANCRFIEHYKNSMLNILKQRKLILQLDLNSNIIKVWKSTREARREYGDSITHCLSGKYKTGYGFLWKYAKEELS